MPAPAGPITLFETGFAGDLSTQPQPYFEVYQRQGSIVNYGIDWTGRLANRWEGATNFAAGSKVRPSVSNGLQALCTVAGYTGSLEPEWPDACSDVILDGSAQWTMQAIDATSLGANVTAANWTTTAGLSILGSAVTGQITVATVSTQGALSGTDYDANCAVTLSGTDQVYVGKIRVKVR